MYLWIHQSLPGAQGPGFLAHIQRIAEVSVPVAGREMQAGKTPGSTKEGSKKDITSHTSGVNPTPSEKSNQAAYPF